MGAAPVLLALSWAASLVALSHADGTILELHTKRYFGGDPTWVVPDAAGSSEGAPLGCQNLPKGYRFSSGRVYWNATAGQGVCRFIWFYFKRNCQGAARGIEAPPKPADPSVPWATQDAAYARTTYYKVKQGKSIGCSFDPDPCVQNPCEDKNARCISSLGWSFQDSNGTEWANQVRNCSLCKEGYNLIEGKCQNSEDMCAALACPAEATCETAVDQSVFCLCPAGKTWNNDTKQCTQPADKAWMHELNQVRQKAVAPQPRGKGVQRKSVSDNSPLLWDDELAAVATNWTQYLNSTQCGQDPVLLSKIPNSNYSESDVWVSWSTDETSAVQLWAPSPTDDTNPRTARITDPSTRRTGCGKTVCGTGAFFTCLFYPKTY